MVAGVEDEPADEDAPNRDVVAGSVVAGDAVGGPPVIVGSRRGSADDAIERPRAPITVEQAYLAKLTAAGGAPSERDFAGGAPGPREAPVHRRPPVPPRRPPGPVTPMPVTPVPPPHLRARPRIEPEQGILGLSRHTRSRLGSRLFNLFFVLVFALILVQMIVALLAP